MSTSNTTALIIFVRNPVLGKVKTRLARDIGDEKALEVYRLLLKHTHDITLPLNCRKFVYYADEVNDHDLWNSPGYTKRQQFGKDLGERMYNSFKDLFGQGFKKVLIIGSDCYQLQTHILEQGMLLLDINSAVMGPALDGGYYLLGLSSFRPELFYNKAWGTGQVASLTIDDFHRLGIPYSLLEKLADVDKAADLTGNLILI